MSNESDRTELFNAIRAALEDAVRAHLSPNAKFSVEIDPTTMALSIYVTKTVVRNVVDQDCEILIADARRIDPTALFGDVLKVPSSKTGLGRIAAQTAAQVLMAKIKAAEKARPEKLLIATGNQHKAREISQFLLGVPWKLVTLKHYPFMEAPDEDGDSFEANARIKAAFCSKHLRVACVADDSGIVIDALNGAPGIYSARYAGDGCTDEDNNAKVLDELLGVPESERTARFVCCCVFMSPNGETHVKNGVVEGRIAFECRGDHGFGYDPLFIPNGYDRTFGELDPAIKADISHRSRAFWEMRRYLEKRR